MKDLNQLKYDISVIIPAYNTAEHLGECLESVLGIPVREVIVVNDGSTDNTLSVLRRYESEHNNMKVIDQVNQGPSAARNAGLNVAKGKYVYYVDSDDIVVADTLIQAYEKCEENDLDMLWGTIINFYHDETIAETDARTQTETPMLKGKYDINKVSTGVEALCELKENEDYTVGVCKYLCRRSLIEDAGIRFAEGIIFEDAVYTLDLLLKANRIGLSNLVFIRRRLHEDSIEHSGASVFRLYSYIRGLVMIQKAIRNYDFQSNYERQKVNTEVYRRMRYSSSMYRKIPEEQIPELISMLNPEECNELYSHIISDVERRDRIETLKERCNKYKVNNQKLNQKLKENNATYKGKIAELKERNLAFKTKVAEQNDQIKELKAKNRAVKESKSYRIGNAIVKPFKFLK